MVLEVIFETKHKIIPQGAVTYAVNCMGVCGYLCRMHCGEEAGGFCYFEW